MDSLGLCLLVLGELLGIGVIGWIVVPMVRGRMLSKEK